MRNFYAPRSGLRKANSEKFLKSWEAYKKSVKCPPAQEVRRMLKLSLIQFGQLLEVGERQASRLCHGEIESNFGQKLLLIKAIEFAHEKGFIKGEKL